MYLFNFISERSLASHDSSNVPCWIADDRELSTRRVLMVLKGVSRVRVGVLVSV
jgi:hypothetical protein